MIAYVLGLAGMWVLCDGWFSLNLYIGKPGQSWVRDHSIRLIRCAVGLALMAIGAYLIWQGLTKRCW